jgi:tight adherence protein B
VASALIIGCLPFVMGALMSVFSPDYLGALFTTPLGHLLLMGAGGSLLVGAAVMRQMVRFET